MTKRDHRADKNLAAYIVRDAFKELAVELDFVRLQPAEETRRRVADAKIIDRHAHALTARCLPPRRHVDPVCAKSSQREPVEARLTMA